MTRGHMALRAPFALALALAACGEAEPATSAEPEAEAAAQDPAQALADGVAAAIRANDGEAFDALVNLEGANDIVRNAYMGLTRQGILGRPINGVSLSPPDPAINEYDHEGVVYRLNGEQVGRVTIDFTMDNPEESESFSFAYGLADGRAQILVAVPPAEI